MVDGLDHDLLRLMDHKKVTGIEALCDTAAGEALREDVAV